MKVIIASTVPKMKLDSTGSTNLLKIFSYDSITQGLNILKQQQNMPLLDYAIIYVDDNDPELKDYPIAKEVITVFSKSDITKWEKHLIEKGYQGVKIVKDSQYPFDQLNSKKIIIIPSSKEMNQESLLKFADDAIMIS